MASQFTDPSWWQPRPRRPQEISATKVIVGTLVPAILVVGAVVAVIVTSRHKGQAKAQSERSVAAFSVCMSAHGITASTKSGSPAQQQALDDCRETLPSGTRIGNFSAGASAEEQFGQCMRDAGGGRPRRSRFGGGGGPSSSFLNALTVCRSLVETGQPALPAAPVQTSTAPPIA